MRRTASPKLSIAGGTISRAGEIDAITIDRLNDHLAQRAFESPTLVTIGPEALRLG